ncbi:tRNA pseudouridine synthase A [metagenome]|uniref:tRNA pseudouridine synthase A n=1 Tax=metagenome TaxID=256318 RepID=A0A2P2C796_9ZZZZ
MRIRIDLAYDGTDFSGWATQPGLRTVQETVESALATSLRTPTVRVTCAGRTDAGVHARAQVGHADLEDGVVDGYVGRAKEPPLEALTRRLNGILPLDVRVHRVVLAPEGFDARFSALWRRYAYRVADSAATVDPLARHQVLAWQRPLDPDRMNAAAALLLGEHDFAAFCRRREGATTIRTLLDLEWSRDDRGLLVADVRADAFCHNMVRSIVGCLLAVGDGRREPDFATEVLTGRVRDGRVTVAQPRGLTLEQVAYPPDAELAQRAIDVRTVRSLD